MSREAARIVAAGNKIPPQAERKAARTCKKLPVASFCASETAERMPQGRRKDLIGLARSRHCGGLIRGLQNLEASFGKGFNCYGAKLRLRCADSRFAKPRGFLRGRTGCHFLHRAKSNQKARGTPSCDLDSKLCRK